MKKESQIAKNGNTYLETTLYAMRAGLTLYAMAMIATHGIHINPAEIIPQTIEAGRHIYDTAVNIGEEAILYHVPFIGGLVAGLAQNAILFYFTDKRLKPIQKGGTGIYNDDGNTDQTCLDPRRDDVRGRGVAGGDILHGALPTSILVAGYIVNHATGPAAAFLTGMSLGSNLITAEYIRRNQKMIINEQIALDNANQKTDPTRIITKNHFFGCLAQSMTNAFSFAAKAYAHNVGFLADIISIPNHIMGGIVIDGIVGPITAIKSKGRAGIHHSIFPSKINHEHIFS